MLLSKKVLNRLINPLDLIVFENQQTPQKWSNWANFCIYLRGSRPLPARAHWLIVGYKEKLWIVTIMIINVPDSPSSITASASVSSIHAMAQTHRTSKYTAVVLRLSIFWPLRWTETWAKSWISQNASLTYPCTVLLQNFERQVGRKMFAFSYC